MCSPCNLPLNHCKDVVRPCMPARAWKQTTTETGTIAYAPTVRCSSAPSLGQSAQQGGYRRWARVQQRVCGGAHRARRAGSRSTVACGSGSTQHLGRMPQHCANQPRKESPHAGTGSRKALDGWRHLSPQAIQRVKIRLSCFQACTGSSFHLCRPQLRLFFLGVERR